MVGQTISHYRITEKLGEGGMGVVYKAEDTKLERTVALKFLAGHLLNDDEARQRFLREAKAAAVLSHPNICHVYEIDQAEGKTFLAMEFVEGETLEDHIAKGPLSLKDALDIGRQAADGLEAAHEKGIVHRDIKPANVLLDAKGRATIMDFGLARLTEASRLTKGDQTMGTVAYMSPEQVQGMEVDRRSDIWALGCVLYEMVTGVRPFQGQYDQALAYEIVQQEPEPLTGVRAGVPMELEFIVGKCLGKDASDRYQSAKEIAVDLRTLAEKLKSGRSAVLRSPAVGASLARSKPNSVAPSVGGRAAKYLPWALVGVAALYGAWVSFLHFGEALAWPETFRFTVEPPPGASFAGHRGAANPNVSPDGRLLAFVAAEEGSSPVVWIRPLDALHAIPLAGTEGARYPFWSPDSRFLGFFSDSKLKKIDVEGGPPQTLCDAPAPRGGAWRSAEGGAEDLIVFAPSNFDGLSVVSADGGEPRSVTDLDEELGHNAHRAPHFLPGGEQFFYMARTGRPETYGVYVGRLDGVSADGSSERFLDAEAGVWYAPPARWNDRGHILFQREDTLLAQELDLTPLSTLGHPLQVAQRVTSLFALTIGSFSASKNGVLAYQTEEAVDSQLIWFDRTGDLVSQLGEPGLYGGLSFSPDGETVAVTRASSPQTHSDIWLLDLGRGGTATRFELGASYPVWSPDGRTIAFRSDRATGTADIFARPIDGSRDAESLVQSDEGSFTPLDWTNDGRRLVYQAYSRGPTSLWTVSLDRNDEPQPYQENSTYQVQAQLSPDGRWFAYVSSESGRQEVYLQQFPVPAGKVRVSTQGGNQPRWAPKGDELYFVELDRRLMAVSVQTAPSVEIGSPQLVLETRMPCAGGRDFCYDVSPDGDRFLVVTATRDPRQAIEVVVNWQAQLSKR